MAALNGFKLIALVPMFRGTDEIRYYYAVVDRACVHENICAGRYVVVCTGDPTHERWDYSVSYHDNITEAMRSLYVTANLHIVGKAIYEEKENA